MPDGRIGHAELVLAGGRLYLSDAHPEIGVVAPTAGRGHGEPGADRRRRRCPRGRRDGRWRTVGARDRREAYGSRNATIVDPFGHRWMLQQPLDTAPASEAPPAPWHQGDVGYVSLNVPDVDRRSGLLLRRARLDVREPQCRRPSTSSGSPCTSGSSGAAGPPDLFCAYAVGDADAAAPRVRAAGGTAGAPTEEPWGRSGRVRRQPGQALRTSSPRAPTIRGEGHR